MLGQTITLQSPNSKVEYDAIISYHGSGHNSGLSIKVVRCPAEGWNLIDQPSKCVTLRSPQGGMVHEIHTAGNQGCALKSNVRVMDEPGSVGPWRYTAHIRGYSNNRNNINEWTGSTVTLREYVF